MQWNDRASLTGQVRWPGLRPGSSATQESLQPSEYTSFYAAMLNAVWPSKNCLQFHILKEVLKLNRKSEKMRKGDGQRERVAGRGGEMK